LSSIKKLLLKILTAENDKNIDFEQLRNLLKRLGFEERIKGSHHIFYRDGVEEIINLQSTGHLAKEYQIKQIRSIILNYKLGDI
jgi:predicted RNA binding protein YcfA (HicA-like mRNA interferase family)